MEVPKSPRVNSGIFILDKEELTFMMMELISDPVSPTLPRRLSLLPVALAANLSSAPSSLLGACPQELSMYEAH